MISLGKSPSYMADKGQRQIGKRHLMLLSVLGTFGRDGPNLPRPVEFLPRRECYLARSLCGDENELQRQSHFGAQPRSRQLLPEDSDLLITQAAIAGSLGASRAPQSD